MTRRLRTLGPFTTAALTTAIALEIAWVAVAPIEHLRSHAVRDIPEAPAVADVHGSFAEAELGRGSEGSASDPSCATCLLLAVNAFALETTAPVVSVADEAHRSYLPPLARITAGAPVVPVQARAPPSV